MGRHRMNIPVNLVRALIKAGCRPSRILFTLAAVQVSRKNTTVAICLLLLVLIEGRNRGYDNRAPKSNVAPHREVTRVNRSCNWMPDLKRRPQPTVAPTIRRWRRHSTQSRSPRHQECDSECVSVPAAGTHRCAECSPRRRASENEEAGGKRRISLNIALMGCSKLSPAHGGDYCAGVPQASAEGARAVGWEGEPRRVHWGSAAARTPARIGRKIEL